jgi:hypothetical protein
MKKLLFTIALLISAVSFGQSFELSDKQVDDGPKIAQGSYKIFTPVLVLEVTGSAEDLYNKTINWVNETYKNPDEVIKGKVEGKYVRINGFVASLISANVIGTTITWDVRYSLEIKFRENKLRYEVTKMEQFIPASQYGSARWDDMAFGFKVVKRKGKANKKTGLRSPGKIDKDGARNYESVKSYFENLGLGIKEYVENNNSESASDDDW